MQQQSQLAATDDRHSSWVRQALDKERTQQAKGGNCSITREQTQRQQWLQRTGMRLPTLQMKLALPSRGTNDFILSSTEQEALSRIALEVG